MQVDQGQHHIKEGNARRNATLHLARHPRQYQQQEKSRHGTDLQVKPQSLYQRAKHITLRGLVARRPEIRQLPQADQRQCQNQWHHQHPGAQQAAQGAMEECVQCAGKGGLHQPYIVSANSSRPISMRRISDVPAPISYNLASRHRRPSGYSLM